jgi:glutaredoxin
VRRLVFSALIVLTWGIPAGAQTPACDALDASRRRAAEAILASEYLWECCDDTISRCLEAEPRSRLATLIADDVCRRVAAGQDADRIRRGLSRRARSMVGGGGRAEIHIDDALAVGPKDAPVTVVVYACARCPYCSRLVPELHTAVTGGELAGTARLAFRIFPIRGHEGSTEAGLGFAAAADMGAFWPFLLHAYSNFDAFTPGLQPQWAAAVGLDPAEFSAHVRDPEIRESVVASKKEGLVNGVTETPTLFLNGRHWVGDLEYEELVSASVEEAARVKGTLCESE